MKKILRIGLSAAALFVCGVAAAQPPVLIHSHNDYARRVPFYQAYAQQVASIEADVFLRDGKLLVGHEVGGAVARHDLRGALRGACRDAFSNGTADAPGGIRTGICN